MFNYLTVRSSIKDRKMLELTGNESYVIEELQLGARQVTVVATAPLMARQRALLEERYDLSNRPAKDVTMTGGKPV